MRIHRYELSLRPEFANPESRQRYGVRRGALILHDGGVADIHPWESLGDLPLDIQLEMLGRGLSTPLIERAKVCLALSRQKLPSVVIENHFQAPPLAASLPIIIRCIEQACDLGYSRFKFKCSGDDSEAKKLAQVSDALQEYAVLFRLDFGMQVPKQRTEGFFSQLRDRVLEKIEFVEDPFTFDADAYEKFSERFQVRLALDQAPSADKSWIDNRIDQGTAPFLFTIIKPGSEDPGPLLASAAQSMRRCVFTSRLDHPVGQVFAAHLAGFALSKHPLLVDVSGIASHMVYATSEFSEVLGLGPQMRTPAGHLFGLEDLLNNLKWSSL